MDWFLHARGVCHERVKIMAIYLALTVFNSSYFVLKTPQRLFFYKLAGNF